jgi:DNA-binding response OmpR family regulator
VIIVEDQALLAMELDYVLSEAGHIVVGCAMDSDEAVRIAAETRPDVALVDVNLRDGVSGPAVARQLIEAHGSIVVFLTANPEQIPEGFSGAIGVLTKPFDAPTIRAVVEFAGRFHRERSLSGRPARLRLAPWLLDPPADAPRH